MRRPLLVLLSIVAVLLGACAGHPTRIDAHWVRPPLAGKHSLRSVMVMSAVRDSTNRRLFEDRMTAALNAAGVKAVQSYKFIPEEGPLAEDRLRGALAQAGVSHAMVTRIINVSTQVNVSPGMVMGPPMGYGFGGFYGYYGGMWATSYYVPPTVYTTQHVAADTRLFETANYTLVWSASTTTTPSGGSVESMLQQFSQLIVDSLAKDGLV